ncbi:MAG: HAD-IC family P-type ATPase [Candidatus Nanopelagicales bacterium]|nr:HAD-IC family P-type ATPase [Candidatus Nanopelagicales bacterium]MDZ4249341.1 HAD-IC family P-type ATPase [Candidatus Nanopelagicales bacterium]
MSAPLVEIPAPTTPDPAQGLSTADVERRVAAGLTNDSPEAKSRSLGDIVRANTLTPFNALLGTLWVMMILVAPPQDTLFGLVIIANTAIGVIQEYRASRALAELSVIGEARPTVRRDGNDVEVRIHDVVRDDLLVLNAGDQLVVDGEVVASAGMELDESLLTGEADSVPKAPGDELMSGSFVAAGSGLMVAQRVGPDSFAAGITAEAKHYAMADSELRDSVMRFIKVVGVLIIPVGILLVISQMRADQPVKDAIRGSIAGMVTMIPEGLVLLTSIAMAVAVIRLAQRKALVQELPAVEALARTDVVCVDKTGTLTDPGMGVRAIVPLASHDPAYLHQILGALAASDPRPNPTMDAVRDECPDPFWPVTVTVPFSSSRKWSSASFADHGCWVIGAPEIVDPGWGQTAWAGRVEEETADGARVLLLASAVGDACAELPLPTVVPVALVVIDQHLRSDAKQTIDFFDSQGVSVKVISGDNAASVGAIARRAGVAGADNPVDASTLPVTVPELGIAMDDGSVFGRVTPAQKQLMVDALQSRGHTVTMTGDGVNDVLALKRADLGIAMGSGAPATRAVAQVVLLDNKWATLPQIVYEGRRVLGNIERVADVFLTKSIYAMVISLSTGLFGVAFPFLPRHLTLIGSLTIGIPGFFLALMPNTDRFRPGFFRRVLLFAVPAGIVAAAATFTSYLLAIGQTSEASARVDATISLFVVALAVLLQSARPLNLLRLAVVAIMALSFVTVIVVPALSEFFAMRVYPDSNAGVAVGIGLLGAAVILLITPFIDRRRRS